jgi:hypothetical protein
MPIYILNVSSRVFINTTIIRPDYEGDHVVRPTHNIHAGKKYPRLGGYPIWNNPWIASEKLNGIISKIDFEKTYDKVKCSFLQQTPRWKDSRKSGVLWSIILALDVVGH